MCHTLLTHIVSLYLNTRQESLLLHFTNKREANDLPVPEPLAVPEKRFLRFFDRALSSCACGLASHLTSQQLQGIARDRDVTNTWPGLGWVVSSLEGTLNHLRFLPFHRWVIWSPFLFSGVFFFFFNLK